MRIYVVDDEPIALRGSAKIIQGAASEAEIREFSRAKAVFRHIEESGERPDVVFCDIEMPGMSGLDFAVRLKEICPEVILIFVTAYSQYALDAFRLHAHGYILKPLSEQRIREELDYALRESSGIRFADTAGQADGKQRQEPAEAEDSERKAIYASQSQQSREKLQVQCFGYFEVFWNGLPLMFGRRQTKELFAYLIDRRGAACTAEEIAAALWENEDNMKNLKSRIRILISDLRRVLASIGQENIVIRRSGLIAVRKEAIDCDYYRMLAGDIDALNAFHGEYMVQYSWAEATAGKLAFDR